MVRAELDVRPLLLLPSSVSILIAVATTGALRGEISSITVDSPFDVDESELVLVAVVLLLLLLLLLLLILPDDEPVVDSNESCTSS